jgi:hypothetical protein
MENRCWGVLLVVVECDGHPRWWLGGGDGLLENFSECSNSFELGVTYVREWGCRCWVEEGCCKFLGGDHGVVG